MAASSAFAGVGIGGWGRGIWAPVAGNGTDVYSFQAASWGPESSNIRTGISIGAVSFMAGVSKGFSNGVVGCGFEGIALNNSNEFNWAVPVKVEYWF